MHYILQTCAFLQTVHCTEAQANRKIMGSKMNAFQDLEYTQENKCNNNFMSHNHNHILYYSLCLMIVWECVVWCCLCVRAKILPVKSSVNQAKAKFNQLSSLSRRWHQFPLCSVHMWWLDDGTSGFSDSLSCHLHKIHILNGQKKIPNWLTHLWRTSYRWNFRLTVANESHQWRLFKRTIYQHSTKLFAFI